MVTKSNKIIKKVGQVWYDKDAFDYYTILKIRQVDGMCFIDIKWDNYGIVMYVPNIECYNDEYYRTLSRLEMYLWGINE